MWCTIKGMYGKGEILQRVLEGKGVSLVALVKGSVRECCTVLSDRLPAQRLTKSSKPPQTCAVLGIF